MSVVDGSTYAELLARRVELTPDAPMIYESSGLTLSFGEFAARVAATEAALIGFGVDRDSTVSWQLPNCADALVAFMALSGIGARQSPLLAAFREREMSAVLGATRSELLLTPGRWRGTDLVALGRSVIQALELDTNVITVEDLLAAGPGGEPAPAAVPPGTSRYLYATSGSTGVPKLVRHTDRSLLAGALAQGKLLGLEPSDVNAMLASVAHIGGPVNLAQCLAHGNALVLLDSFDPATTPALMGSLGVTTVSATPATLVALVEHQRHQPERALLPRLRFCISGAAPKPPDLHSDIQRILGGRGLMMGYGMTETGSIGVPAPDDSDEQLENTVGRIMPGMEIRILDGSGAEAGPDSPGEIRVRGPMVCEGYLDDEQSRAGFDSEGWIITGDLGRLRPDGHLCVTGRIKDLIIRKGENIAPKEIEDALYGIPGAAEVAVVGRPDPLLGERVCAVITAAPGQEPPELDALVARCREAGLMRQKYPEEVVVLDEMPHTALGKIDKSGLRLELEHLSGAEGRR